METILYLPAQTALVLPLLAVAAGLSVYFNKMDVAGAAAGMLVALGLFLGGGWPMLLLLLVFFIAGSGATSWRLDRKVELGLAEQKGGRRSVANVVANGGAAAMLGLWAWFDPTVAVPVQVMMGATLAAATSDTLSSELGNVYGRRYVRITTFTPDVRGADGVVSLEGTLFGLAGSLLIALLYGGLFGSPGVVFLITLAGMTGNLIDSLLGATLQRRGWLNNHQVNFCNTLTAALVAAGGAAVI